MQRGFLRECGLSDEEALLHFNLAPLETRRDIAKLGLIHRSVLGGGPRHFANSFCPLHRRFPRNMTNNFNHLHDTITPLLLCPTNITSHQRIPLCPTQCNLVTLGIRLPIQPSALGNRSLMWPYHITGTPGCSTPKVDNQHPEVTTAVAPRGVPASTNEVFPATPTQKEKTKARGAKEHHCR